MVEYTRIIQLGFLDGNQRKMILKLAILIILFHLIFTYLGKQTFLSTPLFPTNSYIPNGLLNWISVVNLAGLVLAVMGWRIHQNRF